MLTVFITVWIQFKCHKRQFGVTVKNARKTVWVAGEAYSIHPHTLADERVTVKNARKTVWVAGEAYSIHPHTLADEQDSSIPRTQIWPRASLGVLSVN